MIITSPFVNMEKRKWVAPNDLITLKKPKRPRIAAGKGPTRHQSSTPISSSPSCDLIVGEDLSGSGSGSDWQLKSKVRILCRQDFVWLDLCKPQHEARALAGVNKSEDKDACVLFHQSLMVWMHPFFPFFNLFPRTRSQMSNTRQEAMVLSESQLGLMKEHWSSSFHSLFEVLHNGHCPYFYLCANSTTILFLAGSEASHTLALLSPTTSGFRYALAQQGVQFTLPLCSAKESDMMHEVEDADWLKHMAAQDQRFSLIQQTRESCGSNLSNSLVVVDGVHFHALVNFILNSKLLVSSDGLYAGIPPTLLAPTPFLGATINSLKVKRSHVMEPSGENGTLTKSYCLDITGPILPHNTELLRTVLDQSHPNYTMQSHVTGTSAFNQYFSDKKKSV